MYNSDIPKRADLPSSKQLLISTFLAVIVASVLLVTVVLPAEYGVDPTRVGRIFGLTEMGEIKMKLAAEAKKAEKAEAAQLNSKAKAEAEPKEKTEDSQEKAAKTEEMTITLKPGDGVEIKMDMLKGAKVKYEWKANGGTVNHDTHGDGPKKAFISYKKGRNVKGDEGEITAGFDGSHGWFWRNRSGGNVEIKLKVEGDYKNIKKMG